VNTELLIRKENGLWVARIIKLEKRPYGDNSVLLCANEDKTWVLAVAKGRIKSTGESLKIEEE
jgi:hypothetical protein